MPPRPIGSPNWYRSPKTSIGIFLIGTQPVAPFLHVDAIRCAFTSCFSTHYCNVFCNRMEHLTTLCYIDKPNKGGWAVTRPGRGRPKGPRPSTTPPPPLRKALPRLVRPSFGHPPHQDRGRPQGSPPFLSSVPTPTEDGSSQAYLSIVRRPPGWDGIWLCRCAQYALISQTPGYF